MPVGGARRHPRVAGRRLRRRTVGGSRLPDGGPRQQKERENGEKTVDLSHRVYLSRNAAAESDGVEAAFAREFELALRDLGEPFGSPFQAAEREEVYTSDARLRLLLAVSRQPDDELVRG